MRITKYTTKINQKTMRTELVKEKAVNNHPSGDVEASREDILFTKRIKNSGQLLNVELLDHIIIGANYTSFKELGQI